MQDLKVIGVENGAIVAVGDDGERFRIAVDDTLQSKIRQVRQRASAESPKLSPREVQAQIRAGLSAEEVASVTGAPLDYVQRFEGPIVAEREHIVANALSVPVRTSAEVDALGDQDTFGSVIRERLAALGVVGERWAGWKDSETGWIVKLEFTVDQIDHDARWTYDARKHSLAPLNSEATTLSQAGELRTGALIPRLRAVLPDEDEPDTSRFDSGAFAFPASGVDPLSPEVAAPAEPLDAPHIGRASNAIAVSAIKRADETPRDLHQTADLLEALRRRRGEREGASYDNPPEPQPSLLDDLIPSPAPLRIAEEPNALTDGTGFPPAAGTAETSASQTGPVGRKKGRAAMPSWDEIVFGARTDDDLA
ncbi:DNA-binding protein [Leifsonia xyli subsp. xyli]|uniref:DNA-binding protein n=2 Tax=Leifsonia xyli subsp. xyli TaxID=59736 RepID=Q6AFE3_LEIXX|nr:septation protein SepH [Leifsonia xyli]AAT88902.1 DNA-binding protein [Leifsonia xyli subsp. xyli str. CTCB07]ODA90385.1 DNA-binding protein [Leifsonia xyli subsp. xyli]